MAQYILICWFLFGNVNRSPKTSGLQKDTGVAIGYREDTKDK
jgi:hypothetical protein